jgi:hypothetical protein
MFGFPGSKPATLFIPLLADKAAVSTRPPVEAAPYAAGILNISQLRTDKMTPASAE